MGHGVFVTDPYLLTLDPAHEMNVVWIQRSPVPGIVEFGSTHKLGKIIEAECRALKGLYVPRGNGGYGPFPEDNTPAALWQCTAKIGGLHPDKVIYYRCVSGNETSDVFDFHTAPKPGRPYRFAQMSDLQGFLPCEDTVYRSGCMRPDFILYSGDATFYSWRADQWFDLDEPWQSEDSRKRAFFPCMQQRRNARLLQYCPLFFCPGNHEVDDMRVGTDKDYSRADDNWHWNIFMQIFRPLYPDDDHSLSGKRWYSVDYGDMHIVSLSVQRWALWDAYETPGWRLTDSIAPGSPQLVWLERDLAKSRAKFKWVIIHWHILNKGVDVQNNLCPPQISDEGEVSYPYDYAAGLSDIFERYGVNAVTYGHSHVYERYFYRNVHYIEAAYFGVCCRAPNAPFHPSGIRPVVEDNSCQSFLIVERRDDGLSASGYYSKENPVLFDAYQIADGSGCSIPAKQK